MRDPIRNAIPTCFAVLLIAAAPTATAASDSVRDRTPAAAAVRTAAPVPGEPFARVYLATRGCMSCSYCRTTIRQMLKPKTQGGESRLGDDQIEVKYRTSQIIPLRDVIQALAKSRLHDLSVVDVLFEAGGTLQSGPKGAVTFVVAKTGQAFPVTIDRSANRPADATPVRATWVVDGWQGKGELSLRAKAILARP